jgi:hypothetical protein
MIQALIALIEYNNLFLDSQDLFSCIFTVVPATKNPEKQLWQRAILTTKSIFFKFLYVSI